MADPERTSSCHTRDTLNPNLTSEECDASLHDPNLLPQISGTLPRHTLWEFSAH